MNCVIREKMLIDFVSIVKEDIESSEKDVYLYKYHLLEFKPKMILEVTELLTFNAVKVVEPLG